MLPASFSLLARVVWTAIMSSKSRSSGANRRRRCEPSPAAGGAIVPFDLGGPGPHLGMRLFDVSDLFIKQSILFLHAEAATGGYTSVLFVLFSADRASLSQYIRCEPCCLSFDWDR